MYNTVRRPFLAQEAPAAGGIDVKKAATSLVTLGVLGSAAWVGINAGLKSKDKTAKALGWVGGVGSALVGLAALSGMAGQRQVTQTLLLPFNLPQA
jgi:hypothetical protein